MNALSCMMLKLTTWMVNDDTVDELNNHEVSNNDVDDYEEELGLG